MKLSRQLDHDFNFNKRLMVSDYKVWKDEKQKGSSMIKILQRENQKLMKQNIALRKQNQKLLEFKENYLKELKPFQLNKNLLTNIDTLGYHSDKKFQLQNNQFRFQRKQKRYQPAKSARNYSQISTRIQNRLSETQQILNSRRSSMSKGKRRFNYLGGCQEWKEKIGQTQIQKQQKDTNKFFEDIQLKESQDVSLRVSFKQQSNKQIQQTSNIIKKQVSNQNRLEQQKLQSEIRQLRDIQSKLLDKIQERDSIIEKLHYLLTIQKEKSKFQIKQADRQTIDTTFSPKTFY